MAVRFLDIGWIEIASGFSDPLYEAKYFNRLIEDVEPLVRDLVDMFPAEKEQQQQLSPEEAQELQHEKGVAVLQEVNEGEDELLQEAIEQVIVSEVKRKYIGNVVKDEVRAR